MANANDRQIRSEVRNFAPKAIEWRRHFHRYPELSWQETGTQARILELLSEAGLDDVRAIAKTGATALIQGKKPGPVVAWRADIDALPIPERGDPSFISANPGVMHACGHDAHIAIALAVATLLAKKRESFEGAVRFIFQPAEEADDGAKSCIADGVLENPTVQRVLGLHISADLPIGTINVAPGPFFAAPTWFKVVIRGQGGHAAAPHQSIDAVVVAAHVITALQTVVSRSVAPSETAVLTIGTMKAGFRSNVIAESATLSGTIRTYTDRLRAEMVARAEEIVTGVAAAFGATAEFSHETNCPPLVNDPAVSAFVEAEARQFFGQHAIFASQSMGADDMAVFLQHRPGCYFWLGARNEAMGIAGRHHDPEFVIDENAIAPGIEFAMRLIEKSLRDLR